MTPLYAVLGHPVAHSLSPAMHRAWLEAEELPGDYVAVEVDPEIPGPALVQRIATLGLAGANLTVPLKTRIVPHLLRLGPDAARIGAVNTVVTRPDGLVGMNTDARGFLLEAEDHGADPTGPGIVVGAGGAGQAVAAGLLLAGAERVLLLNRTRSRAERVRDRLQSAFPTARLEVGPLERLAKRAVEAAVIAVCVSGPGADALAALPTPTLGEDTVWIDLNYWMPHPPHLEVLRRRGHRTGDGARMLVHQGALAFHAFTGVLPDPSVGLAIVQARRSPTRTSS